MDLIEEMHNKLNKYGRILLTFALKSKKAQKEILEFLKLLKYNTKEEKYVNLTDPQAKRVLMKKGKVMFGYLIQTVTHTKTGLIIMQNVVEQETDANQLIDAIDHIQHTYDKIPEYILADNGYYKIESIEYAFHKGITPIIPDRSESMNNNGKNKDNPFAKNNMSYDPINKHFTCPYGEKLKPTSQKND